MSSYIYGLDFGTTNSALAVLNVATNQIEKIFTAPSVLFFPAVQQSYETVNYQVGEEAIQEYVASQMKGRFMKSIKRILPNKSFTHTRIASKNFKAEDLVAMILSFLKTQADDYLGQTINTAVIGRPVVFDEQVEKDELAQQRLAKAAKMSGFTEFYFQMEPVAAAFAYERNLQKDELVLVGDFGGGTSDLPHFGRGVKEKFALDNWLELPNTYFHHICSWEKMNFLNSIKMKEAIKKSYIFSDYNPKVKNLLSLIENNLGYTLFKAIEQSKINLSDNEQADFTFHQHDIDIKTNITLTSFENEIINEVSYKNIDSVFLTGGTSMVHAIQLMFKNKFGTDKIKSGDNFNSVAAGLAYSYNIVKNN